MVLGDSQNASQLLPVFENNKIKAYQGAMNSLSGTEETVWAISLHKTSVYCLKPRLIIVSSLLLLFFILKYR